MARQMRRKSLYLIEGIIYLTKSDDEFYQTYLVEQKGWF